MLKSRGRTYEVLVMGMEEWPQVDVRYLKSISRIRNSSMTKKGCSQKGVMPYAERKGEQKAAVCG